MVQVYTGDGKGKTTAALGLILRAAGAGLSILFVQFVKEGNYSEIKSLKQFGDQVIIKQFGTSHFIKGMPSQEDRRKAQEGLREIERDLLSEKYDLIVLDEASVAVDLNLFSAEDLLGCIEKKKGTMEIVITGRNAHPLILDAADLVTEMKEVKHYYQNGVLNRKGIEL